MFLAGKGMTSVFLNLIFVTVKENLRIQHLLDLIREDPADPFCQYALGLEYASDPQRVDEAIQVFESLRNAHPDYLPTYYQLALLLKLRGIQSGFMEVINQGKALASSTGQKKVFMELDFLIDE